MKEIILMTGLGVISLLLITALVWLFILNKKLKKLTRGKNADSLEGIITENNEKILKLEQNMSKQAKKISHLEAKIMKSIQHISVLRFDALNEKNGKQSFALGLINEEQTGVVLSSIYARDRMNVFAKEIINGKSERTLTKEEEYVINH